MEMRPMKIYSYASCSILSPSSWTMVVISRAFCVLIPTRSVGLLVIGMELSVFMSKRCIYTAGPFSS